MKFPQPSKPLSTKEKGQQPGRQNYYKNASLRKILSGLHYCCFLKRPFSAPVTSLESKITNSFRTCVFTKMNQRPDCTAFHGEEVHKVKTFWCIATSLEIVPGLNAFHSYIETPPGSIRPWNEKHPTEQPYRSHMREPSRLQHLAPHVGLLLRLP